MAVSLRDLEPAGVALGQWRCVLGNIILAAASSLEALILATAAVFWKRLRAKESATLPEQGGCHQNRCFIRDQMP